MRFTWIGIWLASWVTLWAVMEGVAYKGPEIRKLRSTVFFKMVGQLSDISMNGQVDIKVSVAPFFKRLYLQCKALKNLPTGFHGTALVDDHLVRENMAHGCFMRAQKLTHIMNTWLPEEQLIGHKLLRTKEALWKDNHFSVVTPTNQTRARKTLVKPRRKLDDLVIPDDDISLRDQPVTDSGMLPLDNVTTVLEVNSFYGQMTVPPMTNDRDKRQAIAGAITGIGVGFLGLVGAVTSLFHPSASVADVKKIAKDTDRVLGLEEMQIQHLNSSLSKAIELLGQADSEIVYLLCREQVQFESLILYEEIDSLIEGFGQLLHRKLSPTLIKPEELRRAYQEVVDEMALVGVTPIFPGHLQLYHRDVSHRLDKDSLTFVVSMTIMGERKNGQMMLYAFQPFPLALTKGGDTFVIPQVENYYLGIRNNSMGRVETRVLHQREVNECQVIDHVRVCHLMTHQRKTSEGTCLEALHTFALTRRG